MTRTIYITGSGIALGQLLPDDTYADWADWQDPDTQKGYNFIMDTPFEQYAARPLRHRLYAVIVRENDPDTPLGIVMISPPPSAPDLAIRVFAPYRGHGIGKTAFSLGVRYAVEQLHLSEIHAGRYEGNEVSQKMLLSCGFQRFPSGDLKEIHYLTGKPITQYDYIFIREII